MENIIDEVGLITVFLLLLLAAFLLTLNTKANQKRSNQLFALFLIVTSFDISALFIPEVYHQYSLLNSLRVSSVFLQMPLFLFYVKNTCFEHFKIDSKVFLHLLPFGIFLTLFLYLGVNNELQNWYKLTSQLQYYIYIAWVITSLIQFKMLHRQQQSKINKTYQWLMSTTLLFLAGNTLVVIRTILKEFYALPTLAFVNLAISLFGLIVICWFVLKAMRNPDLFTTVSRILTTKKETIKSQEDSNEKLILLEYMQKEKPYLQDNLSLAQLASQLNFSEKELSELINQHMGVHFFDFINGYRIEHAKELLADPSLNIQQIMYDVGFNSKSSFNTAFKKTTSTTPSNYRKSIS